MPRSPDGGWHTFMFSNTFFLTPSVFQETLSKCSLKRAAYLVLIVEKIHLSVLVFDVCWHSLWLCIKRGGTSPLQWKVNGRYHSIAKHALCILSKGTNTATDASPDVDAFFHEACSFVVTSARFVPLSARECNANCWAYRFFNFKSKTLLTEKTRMG